MQCKSVDEWNVAPVSNSWVKSSMNLAGAFTICKILVIDIAQHPKSGRKNIVLNESRAFRILSQRRKSMENLCRNWSPLPVKFPKAGFFRWIHGSYHHASHCKELSSIESLHRVMRIIAKSYCEEISILMRVTCSARESHWRGAMLMRVLNERSFKFRSSLLRAEE